MSYPLSPDVHRHADVQLDVAHFEWRRVVVTEQVADQSAILTHALGAGPIGNACCLNDRVVVAHVVDETHEAIVQHLEGLAEDGFEGRHGGPGDRFVIRCDAGWRFDG